jgi:hypothetical protein
MSVLAKLRADLRELESESLSETCVRFRSSTPALEFLAEEQVEPQFLMRPITTRFRFRIEGASAGQRPIRIRHSGTWKRNGIECSAAADSDENTRQLARRLARHPELTSALMPLDFTECELLPVPGGWEARIVHFGASEVVYRLPAIRQYVRLPRDQLGALLRTFTALREII